MLPVSKSINIPYGIKALGAALLIGYLGCRVVRWLLQCPQASRINAAIKKALSSSVSKDPTSRAVPTTKITPKPVDIQKLAKTEWMDKKVFSNPSLSPPSSAEGAPIDSFELDIIINDRFSEHEKVFIPSLSSLTELPRRVEEIIQFVKREHVFIRYNHIPKSMLQQLDLPDTNKVIPKIVKIETKDSRVIRYYESGVIEEEDVPVREEKDALAAKEQTPSDKALWHWKGRRTYPDGTVHTGQFYEFALIEGSISANNTTLYLRPDIITEDATHALISTSVDGKNQLVVGIKQHAFDQKSYYAQACEPVFSILIQNIKNDEQGTWEGWLLDDVFDLIDMKEFSRYLFATKEVLQIKNDTFFRELLSKIRDIDGLLAQLYQNSPPETRLMLLVLCTKETNSLKDVFDLDKEIFTRNEERLALVRALLLENKGDLLFEGLNNHSDIELLPQEQIFRQIIGLSYEEEAITKQALQALCPEDQATVYQLANWAADLPVLRIMRELGYGGQAPLIPYEGSIFMCDMDALALHERLLVFLTDLRSKKLLVTRSEFQKLFIKNNDDEVNDLVRRDYLEATATRLGLHHIKVAKKMLIIDEQENLSLSVTDKLELRTFFRDAEVYTDTENIKKSSDPLTSEAVLELLSLCGATRIDPQQLMFIVAADGIYIIHVNEGDVDDVYSTSDGIHYERMQDFVKTLPLTDPEQEKIIQELELQRKTYQAQEEQIDNASKIRLKQEATALKKQFNEEDTRLYFDFPIQDIISKASESKREDEI